MEIFDNKYLDKLITKQGSYKTFIYPDRITIEYKYYAIGGNHEVAFISNEDTGLEVNYYLPYENRSLYLGPCKNNEEIIKLCLTYLYINKNIHHSKLNPTSHKKWLEKRNQFINFIDDRKTSHGQLQEFNILKYFKDVDEFKKCIDQARNEYDKYKTKRDKLDKKFERDKKIREFFSKCVVSANKKQKNQENTNEFEA